VQVGGLDICFEDCDVDDMPRLSLSGTGDSSRKWWNGACGGCCLPDAPWFICLLMWVCAGVLSISRCSCCCLCGLQSSIRCWCVCVCVLLVSWTMLERHVA